jgi:hypothetical protein
MPVAVALSKLNAGRQALIPADFRRRKHAQLSACVLVVAFYAVTLTGCDRAERGFLGSSTANTHISNRTANTHISKRTANTHISKRVGSRTPIPLPDRTLLTPPPEPDCEIKTTEPENDELTKREYEAHCYRHAEMIVRDRLELLQSSVDKTIKAVKRSGRLLADEVIE